MDTPSASPKKPGKWYAKPVTWLMVYILVNLIIGAWIVGDYGESTDERFEEINAAAALKAYTSFDELDLQQHYIDLGHNFRFYGSAQTMLFQAAEQNLGPILGAREGVVRHYAYFVSFQVAIAAIYFLVSIFASTWTALAVSILFGTQPLFFGHAFINPKDIPLLAIFTAVVAAGFHLSRKFAAYTQLYLLRIPFRIDFPWAEVKKMAMPRRTPWLALIAAALALLRIFGSQLAKWAISVIYHSSESSLLGRLFQSIAANADSVDLEAYVNKGAVLFTRVINAAIVLFVIGLLAYVLIQLIRKDLLQFEKKQISLPQRSDTKALPLSLYLAAAGAGALWGFSIATRVIALAAGGMVGLCLLLEYRKRSILPLVVYSISASIACYAFWPYLWAFGFQGFLDAISVFADFPNWTGDILFEGQIYSNGNPPPDYMIKLISLQLTAPVILLSIPGFILGLVEWMKKPEMRIKFLLMISWFSLPIIYTVVRETVQYDNFRQYLFILPPLFVFSGMSIDWLVAKIKQRWLLPVITLVCAIPAMISLVQLHPYQYIYFNEFTGGVEGAFREYGLDYWLISYKEVGEWVDENIPAGKTILVWGGGRRIAKYVTHEYDTFSQNQIPPEEYGTTDYVIVSTEYQLDLRHHPDGQVVFSVVRDNAPLVLVLKNP